MVLLTPEVMVSGKDICYCHRYLQTVSISVWIALVMWCRALLSRVNPRSVLLTHSSPSLTIGGGSTSDLQAVHSAQLWHSRGWASAFRSVWNGGHCTSYVVSYGMSAGFNSPFSLYHSLPRMVGPKSILDHLSHWFLWGTWLFSLCLECWNRIVTGSCVLLYCSMFFFTLKVYPYIVW